MVFVGEGEATLAGNIFGTLFRLTTFGESHGTALGAVIDGCPSGVALDLDLIRNELARRSPGQSHLVSQRQECDDFELLSGVFEGKTTGAPLCFLVRNQDARSKDYQALRDRFRPGHADFTYFAKYGLYDHRGGGRASARETVARVIAGAVAKQLLAICGVRIVGGVVQIGSVRAERQAWDQVEANDARSADPDKAAAMIAEIEKARSARDSVGGVVEVQAQNVPPGWGEPVFDKLDAVLAQALMSLPAAKGVEIGAGFAAAAMHGSQMNDRLYPDGFHTNHHGGILGGISTGAPIVARVAFKPTASIGQEQDTIDSAMQPQKVTTLGRHDPCVAVRAVVVVEAMLAMVLCDFHLRQLALTGSSPLKRLPLAYGLKGE